MSSFSREMGYIHKLLIIYFNVYVFYGVLEEKAPELEQVRVKLRETKILHCVTTLKGSKVYQRLARQHWAAAVV